MMAMRPLQQGIRRIWYTVVLDIRWNNLIDQISAAPAEARKAEDASCIALLMPRLPHLIGRVAWVHVESP